MATPYPSLDSGDRRARTGERMLRMTFNVVGFGAFLAAPIAAVALWLLLTDPVLAREASEGPALLPDRAYAGRDRRQGDRGRARVPVSALPASRRASARRFVWTCRPPICHQRPGGVRISCSIARSFAQEPMSTPPTPERILQTGLAFWPAKTLLSAIELGVFTELAHGPQSHDALAAPARTACRGRRVIFSTRCTRSGS